MPYSSFADFFPDIAARETRNLIVPETSQKLPPGKYPLLELYCNEPRCDCRRVFLYIVREMRSAPEAVIAYGWEDKDFYIRWNHGENDPEAIRDLKGPVLNFGSPQTALAPVFLRVVRDVILKDPAYIERIKKHYQLFRKRIDLISKFRKTPKRR